MIHYITTNGVGNAWVGNELRVVKRAGVPVVLHSLRAPGGTFFSSQDIQELNQNTRTLYPVSVASLIVSVLFAPFLFGSRFFLAFANALFSRRESFVIRMKGIWHFVIACDWARKLRSQKVSVIHSQWINSCGTIGMYGSWLLGVPFGFTGHAADLFRERCALRDKIKRAEYIICISYFHRDFYLIYGARPEQLIIGYCGINVSSFAPKPNTVMTDKPFTILSSGRLVEKKGFEYLIEACKFLEGRFDYQCIIGGSGGLESHLKKRIDDLGLQETVKVTGEALLQENIPDFMHQGDCYCLPCVWASDNDVDGLPQMLMEAMACGLPVISTRLVGIPDLVKDRQTGLLLESIDAEAIANAIEVLYLNPELRQDLSTKGRELVMEKFNLETCVEPLIGEFQKRLVD